MEIAPFIEVSVKVKDLSAVLKMVKALRDLLKAVEVHSGELGFMEMAGAQELVDASAAGNEAIAEFLAGAEDDESGEEVKLCDEPGGCGCA